MKRMFVVSVVFANLFLITNIWAQTVTEIKESYGEPTKAYSISKRIWMTPEYTEDGQVCMMRLYPKRISETTNFLGDKLDYWELKKVLSRLAPIEERGEKSKFFFGLTRLSGSVSRTSYIYKKIGFVFYTSENNYFDPIDKDESKNKKIGFLKTGNKESRDTKPKREMTVPKDVEIVTITWRDRVCAKVKK